MSAKKVKLLRKYVKKNYRFKYDELLEGIREEKLRYRIQFVLGVAKRLFTSKKGAANESANA